MFETGEFERLKFDCITLAVPYDRVRTGLKSTLNLEGFIEKSLKIKSVLKSTGKSDTQRP